jgi:hypothetical protein
MHFWIKTARLALFGCLLLAIAACSGQPFFSTTPTVYDLTQRPNEFANKEVTIQGFYLWKPGDPGMSVLVPGVSTADDVRDAQPIYASVECAPDGSCTPSKTELGTASTGAVWLDGFPAEVTSELHTPGDSVWGMVEVTGLFENAGGYGPDGSYRYRMQVRSARALEEIEREVATIPPGAPGEGIVAFRDLVANPEQYAGQELTTQAYYFWSPATSGLLVEGVSREKTEQDSAGVSPVPTGQRIALDGFPPELSEQINVGENNSYVWGLVEVAGTFETGGRWGPAGEYKQHFTITGGQVKVLEPRQ